MSEQKKVAVGLSGGVDSSVAAALLIQQGYDVSGVTMRIWDGSVQFEPGAKHGCYGPDEEGDVEDARAVADFLGIRFYEVDLSKEYAKHVLAYFRSEYQQGRTPNPCMVCNRYLKFGFLWDKVAELGLGFRYFATGHYVRTLQHPETKRFFIAKGLDNSKDQTYFLALLNQEQLGRTIFPLGELNKKEVRGIAAELGLPVAQKAESQDFVGSADYASVIGGCSKPGSIVDQQGKEVGQHQGIERFTLGQRKGLGISAKEPLYVTAIDSERNVVVVGTKEDTKDSALVAGELNWMALEKPSSSFRANVRIRYRHQEAPAEVIPIDDFRVRVLFDQPQYSITPGQAVVFYDHDCVLGGGFIESKVIL